ncbi:MAG: DNA-binding protein [Deltaproteobacteria bacterium HGW-Deltaproteobacteria-12]|jgi:phage regulator Rha-like protein|nr:MAG: DNA-binding protein [Deltaproteobacteria bacterium HGW-Deltaproteobacteria-12]
MAEQPLVRNNDMQNRIHTIRDVQVMLDSDLARFYGVETKTLNRAVKRNIERFPQEFSFQLTAEENLLLRAQVAALADEDALRCQIGTSKQKGGRRYLPFAFTEQGVAMLSGVLKSAKAVQTSIQVINAFIAMRRFLATNAEVFQRLNTVERKQIEYKTESDHKFDQIFNAIEAKSIKPKQGIFFDGQIFDAYQFVSDLIRTARKTIVLIDNYIDDATLTLLSKAGKKVKITILTRNISKQLALDIRKYNEQYPEITVKEFHNSHDRFIMIDGKTVYHFGASLKDLGKKWFAFSRFDKDAFTLMEKLTHIVKE